LADWHGNGYLLGVCKLKGNKEMSYEIVMVVCLVLIMVIGLQIQIRNINKRLDKLDGNNSDPVGK
jgi:hypothetical protein